MTSKTTETQQQEAAEAVGLPKVSQSDLDKAKKEGVLEAAKEAAKDSYKFATDGNLPSDSAGPQYPGKDEIMRYEPLLGLSVEAFKDAIAEKPERGVPEEKVAGLLELERSGQNRTDYVQAICKRLGVKDPRQVTNAGPGYTNDITPITQL